MTASSDILLDIYRGISLVKHLFCKFMLLSRRIVAYDMCVFAVEMENGQ
jgi:hypothetical protein